jgi:glutaredoxin 3
MAVKVFSKPTCPWCTEVKKYLGSKNVEFEEVDVSRSREASMEIFTKTGQQGVPVININGKYIVGFDQVAIDKVLKLKSN